MLERILLNDLTYLGHLEEQRFLEAIWSCNFYKQYSMYFLLVPGKFRKHRFHNLALVGWWDSSPKHHPIALICGVCQFSWYKYCHFGLFQVTIRLTIGFPEQVQTGSSISLKTVKFSKSITFLKGKARSGHSDCFWSELCGICSMN